MKEIIFHGNDIKLIKYLSLNVGITYNVIHKLLREREIKVNGVRVKEDTILKNGDRICLYYDTEYKPKNIYEDENIIICDKKKGIATTGEGSLEETLKSIYGGEVYAVHRLDTNTDGLAIFAKNIKSKDELEKAFYHRLIQKRYACVTCSKPPKNKDIIENYIFKIENESRVIVSDTPKKDYLKAITEYEVMETKGEKSLLEIVLHTGRTHQIRAVLAHIGCPVLGDGKYGLQESGVSKQQLTAYKITFTFEDDSTLFYLNKKSFEIDYKTRLKY